MNKNEECFQIEFVAYKQLIFLVAWSAEVGIIYKRKISRKKERKHTFDQVKMKIQENKLENTPSFKKKVRFKKKQ